MKDELKKLYAVSAEANQAYYELSNEVDNKRNRLFAEAREQINAQLHAVFGERLEALVKARAEASKACEDAEVVEANQEAPWPVGTKLIGWGRKLNRSRLNNTPLEPLAQGILEVVTRETQHPENMRYDRAGIGTYIVRLLKKDGTPGISYEKLGSYRSKQWLPEGQQPKAKAKS